MNFRFVWKRTMGILKTPDKVWSIIASEPIQYAKHYKHFALPYLIVLTLATLIGLLMYMPVYDYSIAYILVRTICIFFVYYFTLFVAVRILHETRSYFKTTDDKNVTGILLIYSLGPFFLGSTLAHILYNYPALGHFLKFAGLFGAYIFFRGTFYFSNIDKKLRNKYILTATGIVVIVYLLLYWSLSYIWQAFKYAYIFTQ